MSKTVTITYDDQAPLIIAKVNKALAENGVPFSFQEAETVSDDTMDFNLVSETTPRSGFIKIQDEELKKAVHQDIPLALTAPERPPNVQDMVDRELLQNIRNSLVEIRRGLQ